MTALSALLGHIISMIITEIAESNGSKDIPIISAIDNVTVIPRSPLRVLRVISSVHIPTLTSWNIRLLPHTSFRSH